ncbi:hypothetical protein [Sphingomonas bacterium]|uniref:hypothetical protein n=1 Tax=Sphingomonas bacterium TaxID=1895847 RepID=UPI001576D138|nr:hypothetical protein [Sphingomonas bacterium]
MLLDLGFEVIEAVGADAARRFLREDVAPVDPDLGDVGTEPTTMPDGAVINRSGSAEPALARLPEALV